MAQELGWSGPLFEEKHVFLGAIQSESQGLRQGICVQRTEQNATMG